MQAQLLQQIGAGYEGSGASLFSGASSYCFLNSVLFCV